MICVYLLNMRINLIVYLWYGLYLLYLQKSTKNKMKWQRYCNLQ